MSFPTWPQTLPQEFMAQGYSNGGEPPVRRQQMESGLDRVTRVSSVIARTNSYSMLCTEKQLAIFWSFYNGPANAGADFVWMPMLTGNDVLMHACRFSSYPVIARHGVEWSVSFSLETDQQQINWG